MTDHAAAAQHAAEEWLERLEECRWADDNGDDDVEWPAELLAPYDGCTTCQVRETLIAAEPHMRAMFDAERAEL